MAKANAPEEVLEAPLQKEGRVKFLPEYKFDEKKKYVFESAVRVPERDLPVVDMVTKRPAPHKDFSPYRNIVLTSQIVWEGERRTIRYYDGCTTLFVDEQPKEEKLIEQYIKQSKKRVLVDGKFSCFGDERMLLIYLTICSWNADSPFRTRTAPAIFIAQNPDKAAAVKSEKFDLIEEALKMAKEATDTKMFIHSNYLGLPDVDWDSDNKLTPKEMRTAYREFAANNAKSFIESYGNKSIEVKYYIDKALEKGLITNKFNPNRATWGSNNSVICDISGLKSQEAISQAIFEFSKSEAGEEFVVQLKALSE